jgi:NADPH:quinone reductase-like Zn-dependent oxidoreductase
MKAYRLDAFNSLDDLRQKEVDDPQPGRGELLVRVHAVSLNYRDIAF